MHELKVQSLNAGWNKTQILFDVTLSVGKGEFVCLTGQNGSGKSTLLSIMAGIQTEPVWGNKAKSVPILALPLKQRAKTVSYMQQKEFPAWNFTVRDIVLTGRFPHTGFTGVYTSNDFCAADKAIETLGIKNLADRNILELSGGELQKARIARCLAQETEFMILDEPTAGLDFTCQEELMELLKRIAQETDKGILISIHDINTAARFSHRMALLPKQKPCITGKPDQLMTESLLSAVYGADIKICTHPIYKTPMAVF
ncbi:ABC transporter ATP-binding protein [Treponema sp.]|uniref:ABC transporter ATP-binding protein n=1 Tax=Treponema sp. TaxID=166 RepID=UPI003F012640